MNKVFNKSSTDMSEVADNSVDLIITSPPYYNVKDYSCGQGNLENDLGCNASYEEYISGMLLVWKECFRVLRPAGKLCINVPLMPISKKELNTHNARHIFDLQSDIQHSILQGTPFYLYDLYIWNRINSHKQLMFGIYPYPATFYSQNTSEFITIYIKDGESKKVSQEIKESSALTQKEWATNC